MALPGGLKQRRTIKEEQEKMVWRRQLGTAIFSLWALCALPIDAQDPAQFSVLMERVEHLEGLVSRLQARVEQLERELKESSRGSNGSNPSVTRQAAPEKPVLAKIPNSFDVYWKEGVRARTADKKFQFRMGGRIANDWAFIRGDDGIRGQFGDLADGTEFRSARLYFSGLIHNRVEFKAQYDFAGVEPSFIGPAFKDVYVGLVNVPVVGGLRAGHFKEPFSLEQLTSGKYITFMERSLLNAFVPSRNTGLMLHRAMAEQRLTWAFGVFRETGTFGSSVTGGDYSLTGRLAGLPWYLNEGEKLLHLGLAYSRQGRRSDLLRFRERPESHLAPRFVNTGFLTVDSIDLLDIEAAIVYGPASVQTEFTQSSVSRRSGANHNFSGFYVQGSYFLSGEHRQYDQEVGAFGRLKPKRNLFAEQGGMGAWELGARYSFIDLEDQDVLGGRMDNFTLGLNWYWNPNSRIMWNYIFANVESIGGSNILQMRFQVDF